MTFRFAALSIVTGLTFPAVAEAVPPEVIRPKVVIVAMFERGEDTGDEPGEFQYWVEREQLDRVIPLPAAYRAVRANADGSVIGLVTGVGNTNAAATIMALGLDPRFDLKKSYWLVAGIAGLDPADASIGSAVWADYVVEGDLGHEIDAREIPAGWKTGYIPLRKKKPYELPLLPAVERGNNCYQLNPGLLQWAYALTKDTPLPDNDSLRGFRARYTRHPKPGSRPPCSSDPPSPPAPTGMARCSTNGPTTGPPITPRAAEIT